MTAARYVRAPRLPRATAGELAVLNLDSALGRSWQRLERALERPELAWPLLEGERVRALLLSDAGALDRLAELAHELCRRSPAHPDTQLIAAQVASLRHAFAAARLHLAQAEALGAPAAQCARTRWALDQAQGVELGALLSARRAAARESGALEDWLPLGALYAELGEFAPALRCYLRALRALRGSSPFAPAWVCFQLGELWGERLPVPDAARAAHWYARALAYLPGYARARVHWAELQLAAGELREAEQLLEPAAAAEPEARWRLAQLRAAQGRAAEAAADLVCARAAFEALLARHELAFADHAAAFYLEAGSDPARACALAQLNLANRPTLRAFELAHAAATAAAHTSLAAELYSAARRSWGGAPGWSRSGLATA